MARKIFLLSIFWLTSQSLDASSLKEQFQQEGYVEMCDQTHGARTYEALYACFDEFIAFLQNNPTWVGKLSQAKERFVRSKDRAYYSTDVFGFYDESTRIGRSQIAFYYSPHFHDFIRSHYPKFEQVSEITRLLEMCFELQKTYAPLFERAATELGLEAPSILLKIVKYFPSYFPTKPHYDGSAFSLFLDSTDNESLCLALYKPTFIPDDFRCPARQFPRTAQQNSMLLIPGAFLTECAIFPTPHIVMASGNTRYATVAFAMRPNYVVKKLEYANLPKFK